MSKKPKLTSKTAQHRPARPPRGRLTNRSLTEGGQMETTYTATERIVWCRVGLIMKAEVTAERAVDLGLLPECRSCTGRVASPNAKWCPDCTAERDRLAEEARNAAAGNRCIDCNAAVSRRGIRCKPCGVQEASRKRSAKANVQHGTPQGYDRHRRLKDQICQPCRDAQNAADRARRAAARKAPDPSTARRAA